MNYRFRISTIIFLLIIFANLQNFAYCVQDEVIEQKPIEAKVSENVVLSLEDCIKIALRNSPMIEISQNDIELYKARLGQAKADYSPQFGVTSGYSNQRSDTRNSLVDEAFLANMSVNQLLYNFGKTPAKINVQKFNVSSSNYSLDNIILQTIFNVKKAYYAVLMAQIDQDIKLRSAQLSERHYELAKGFYDVGLKSYIDVTNAEVYFSNAKIEYVKSMTAYRNAVIALNNAMYVMDNAPYSIAATEAFNMPKGLSTKDADLVYRQYTTPLKTEGMANVAQTGSNPKEVVLKSGVAKHDILQNFKFNPYQIESEQAIKTAYDNRPDLKALLEKEKAAKEALKLSKREYFPDLTANFGTGVRGRDFPLANSLQFGANLNIPLVNPMLTKYRIKESSVNLKTVLANITLQKQNIFFDVQKSYTNLKEIERRIPLLEATVKQAFQNFELADGRYEVGLGNYIELQDAQTNYNNAQMAYAQTVYDYNIARINLEYSMGVK